MFHLLCGVANQIGRAKDCREGEKYGTCGQSPTMIVIIQRRKTAEEDTNDGNDNSSLSKKEDWMGAKRQSHMVDSKLGTVGDTGWRLDAT